MGKLLGSAHSPKRLVFGAIVCATPLLLLLLVLEVVLRTTGDPFQPEDGFPPYLEREARRLNVEINSAHEAVAQKHRFGFNEMDRGPDKAVGTHRIAVVGDSFIFGDGAVDAIRWSRILERAASEEFDNLEILHWGRNGWSTLDQLKFLRTHLRSYEVDTIVVGWVTNDPDVDRFDRWDPPDLGLAFRLTGLAFLFPEVTQWFTGRVDNLFVTRFGFGYGNWEKQLYTSDNLTEYSKVLEEFKELLDAEGIPFVVVLTPNNGSIHFDDMHAKATAIFERLRISYLDLLQPVRSKFGHSSDRRLWANPGNPHPGEPVTKVYAREVLSLLTRQCALRDRQLLDCQFRAGAQSAAN